MSAIADSRGVAPQRRALLMLTVPVVLFGSAWPINKIALQHATPLWFAAGRVVLRVRLRMDFNERSV